MTRSDLFFAALLGASGTLGSAHAADPTCKPVFDAMEKLAITPNHAYTTDTASSRKTPRNSEVITTSSTKYVMAGGEWVSRPFDAKQTLSEIQQRDGNAKVTCNHLRDEAVDGEAASIYSTHNVTDFGTSDQQVWISQSRGLPLRQTIDISEGQSHIEVRYDYVHVQPPADAK